MNNQHGLIKFLPTNIVFIFITMALLALPAVLYFSQKNPVGDIRNRAAELGPYATCSEIGGSCVPNPVECTDSSGTVVSNSCASGVCCIFPTRTPTPMDPCRNAGYDCVSSSNACSQLRGTPYPLLSCASGGFCCDVPVPTPTTCVFAWTCGNPDPLNPTQCANTIYQEDHPVCAVPACPSGQIVCGIIDSCGCPGGGSSPTPSGGGSTRTPTQPPPPPPTRTPTPKPPVSACLNIKIYKNGVQVDPATLRPGDQVVLAVKGTADTTKAHFRINGTQLPGDNDSDPNWSETAQLNGAGEYIFAYTIPSGVVHILVEAEVFSNGVWY